MRKPFSILLNSKEPINEQMLLDYLDGKLTSNENRLVEEWLNSSPLASEAIEGLMQIREKTKLTTAVKEINHSLQKQLRKKHKRNRLLHNKMVYWIIIGVIVVLLICIATFFVVNILHRK